ncbi:MAG: siphovirus Gp157 family protein [Patescibacteria group bacterium]|nr:siphovirus Gp157 family protein [Patescibacteria group bacterium]
MNTSLYVLADEYLQAAEKMADLELDDKTISDTLEGLAGTLEVKATNVAMFIRNLEAGAGAIKEAESKMAARRKFIENRADRIRDYLKINMLRTGITKIECPYFKLSIRDNPPSVVIDAPELVPKDYLRQPEPPPPAPDKKLIAQAIKDGFDVPGAHLERGQRLEIK